MLGACVQPVASPMPSPFADLTPDAVLDAVESQGYYCDARVYPLNSYENRVYQVGIEGASPLIAKFYRPERWSGEQIREEHQWSLQLAAAALPVVAPLVQNGETLFTNGGYFFALYPRVPGAPQALAEDDQLYALGQLLGQLHQQTAGLFNHRPSLNPNTREPAYVLASGHLPQVLVGDYQRLSDQLRVAIQTLFDRVPYRPIRLHGDVHGGNVLWQDGDPRLVDCDDALNGPAVQDLWMLLSGSPAAQQTQLVQVLEGYEEYRPFDTQELALIPSLRALRLMNYSAWLARRWEDRAFVAAFPWFNTHAYWAGHIKQLQEALHEINTLRFHRGQPF
ncbi:MAG TPA: serine/threonine protein kinase [Cellvibrionaceae bacterium]|nr:serine/threonine protein kinase [Cellvibrionaceae bacterium]